VFVVARDSYETTQRYQGEYELLRQAWSLATLAALASLGRGLS
jgi:hypothetical protein